MAELDLTPKRLAGPAAMAAANAVIATVPAGKRWIVRQIIIANTGAATRTILLAVNGTSATAANRIPAGPVPGGDGLVVNVTLPLEATETFQGTQQAGTDCTITLVGIEMDL